MSLSRLSFLRLFCGSALLAATCSCVAKGCNPPFSPPSGWEPVPLDIKVELEPGFRATLTPEACDAVLKMADEVARRQGRLQGRFMTSAGGVEDQDHAPCRALLVVRLKALEWETGGVEAFGELKRLGFSRTQLTCSISAQWVDREGQMPNELVAGASGEDQLLAAAMVEAIREEEGGILKVGDQEVQFSDVEKLTTGALTEALNKCVTEIDRHAFGARPAGGASPELAQVDMR